MKNGLFFEAVFLYGVTNRILCGVPLCVRLLAPPAGIRIKVKAMRKKEKEIRDRPEMEDIIQKAEICRLGLSVGNQPYIVPLNFGFDKDCLYFHAASEGQKIDMIKQNNRVCFELEADCEAVRAETPCDWTMRFRTVIGYGKAFLVTDVGEKRRALDLIVQHYSARPVEYSSRLLERLVIIKVNIETMTGKKSGY